MPGIRELTNAQVRQESRRDSFVGRMSAVTVQDVFQGLATDEGEGDGESVREEGLNENTALPEGLPADVREQVLSATRIALDAKSDDVDSHGPLIRCWDFGGREEYETWQSLFIGDSRSIALLVVDLQKLEHPDTCEAEFAEFCRWAQMVYSFASEPEKIQIVVVGTRRALCTDVDGTWNYLLKRLRAWSPAVYNAWCDQSQRPALVQPNESRMRMVSVENDDDAESDGVGLLELEDEIWRMAGRILDGAESVPLRWFALAEQLRKRSELFHSKAQLREFALGFPGFQERGVKLDSALLRMTRYFRSTGSMILFEVSDLDYFVSVHTEKVLAAISAVVGPPTAASRALPWQRREMLEEEGMLSVETLGILWSNIDEPNRDVLLDILCDVDFIVKLEWHIGGLHVVGIPHLLPVEADATGATLARRWGSPLRSQDFDVTTELSELFPPGLFRSLIANLHRTVGDSRTGVAYIRADAAIFELYGGGRVFVRCWKKTPSSLASGLIRWSFRGEAPVDIGHRCLRQFRKALYNQVRPLHGQQERHLIISDCQHCGGPESVKFEIPRSWLGRGTPQAHMAPQSTICEMCNVHHESTPYEDSSVQPVQPDLKVNPYPRRFDLFLSFHGSHDLSDTGNSFASPGETVRLLARTIIEFVKGEDPSRSPSVFFDEGSVSGRLDSIFDCILQTRGGGIAVFLLTKKFFRQSFCLAELKSCLDIAANARHGEGIQIRLLSLEADVVNMILNDPFMIEHFPNLRDHVVHEIKADTVVAMAKAIAELTWKGWLRPGPGENPAVLGMNEETCFQDLRRFFDRSDHLRRAYLPILKSVLQVPNATDVASAFETALDDNTIRYDNVDVLREVIRLGPAAYRVVNEGAVASFERKWGSQKWEWGANEKDKLTANHAAAKAWVKGLTEDANGATQAGKEKGQEPKCCLLM